MNVLILALKFPPASGGSGTYAYNLALGLHKKGYRVKVLAPKYFGRPGNDGNTEFHVRRMFFASPSFKSLRILFAAFYVFVERIRFRPDVIWTTSFSGCRALGWIVFLKAALIGTIHGGAIHRRYPSSSPGRKIGDRLGMRFMKKARAIVTVSHEAKKIFAGKIRHKEIINKIEVIYNAIDFDERTFISKKDALKDKTVLVTVARLVTAKGQDNVIRLLPRLAQRFPDLCYLIVGEGPERKNLEDLIDSLRVRPYVHMTGYVDDRTLEICYGISDVFVLAGRWTPSFVEGFGIVFLEAGVRGLPVIGTKIGGIPEAIADGKTGLLAEHEDPESLFQAITVLLTDERRRREMGGFAKEHIKATYNIMVMGHHNAALIEKKCVEKSS